MKTCASCFRCYEDRLDAEAKGLKPRYMELGGYCRKPRSGVKLRIVCASCPDPQGFYPEKLACGQHEYRWQWNLSVWWEWHVMASVQDWFRRFVCVPLGMLRKPAPLDRQDYFSGIADQIEPGGLLVCPRCGEVPYSAHHCVFCGQRFLMDDEYGKWFNTTCIRIPPLSAEAKADIEKLFSDE